MSAMASRCQQASLVGFIGSLPVSIASTQIFLGLCWAAFLFRCAVDRRWYGHRTPIDLGVFAFLGACLLATAFSPQPLVSLVGLKKFYLVTAAYLVAFSVSGQRRLDELVGLLVFMASLTAIYGLAVFAFCGQWTLLGTQTMALTTSGILMQVSLLSLGLAVCLRPGPWRLAAVAATAILTVSLVFTKSLSSWLGWLAGGLALLIMCGRRKWAAFAAVSGAVLILAIGLAPSGLFYHYDFREYKTWSWSVRQTIWRTGWEIIKDRPVTGYGLIDFNEIYARKRASMNYGQEADKRSFGHLHNNFLQVAAIGGGAGLAAFCFMLFVVFKFLRGRWPSSSPWAKAYLSGIIASSLAFLVNGLAEWNYGDSEVMTIFWTLAGAALALRPIGVDGGPPPDDARPVKGGTGA